MCVWDFCAYRRWSEKPWQLLGFERREILKTTQLVTFKVWESLHNGKVPANLFCKIAWLSQCTPKMLKQHQYHINSATSVIS